MRREFKPKSAMFQRCTLIVLELLPLFAGIFVVRSKPGPLKIEVYLEKYIVFILLFVLWGLLRELIGSGWIGKRAEDRHRILRFVTCLSLFFLFVASIFAVESRFPYEALQIMLLGVGCGALYGRFLFRGHHILAGVCGVLYYTIIAFSSFQISMFAWEWEPLVFGLSFGTLIVAMRLAEAAEHGDDSLKRFHTALLLLAPTAIMTLCVAGALPRVYYAFFLFIPVASRFLSLDPQWKRPAPRRLYVKQLGFTTAFFLALAVAPWTY